MINLILICCVINWIIAHCDKPLAYSALIPKGMEKVIYDYSLLNEYASQSCVCSTLTVKILSSHTDKPAFKS